MIIFCGSIKFCGTYVHLKKIYHMYLCVCAHNLAVEVGSEPAHVLGRKACSLCAPH